MDLRREFLLDPSVAYLNHGAFGACPRPVFRRYQAWQRELEREPSDFLLRRAPGLLADARAALAAYLGADADEVVFFTNVTTALNVVARSLRLQPGDEVLTTDHEYGALERTWRFICERRGACLVSRALPSPLTDPRAVVEAVWAGVTERTRVLFLSHITSPTGVILPVKPLIDRARAAGIWTVIDGAHAPGQLPVDLHALGADFYGGNCHKWLCAPKGAGFLYARRAVQDCLEPLVVSWGWRPSEPGPSRFVDEQQSQGTRDLAAYLSVPAAIAFQAEHDWTRVRRGAHALAAQARRAIGELTGLPHLTADGPEWYAQMAAVPLPGERAEGLPGRLYERYRVEVPVQLWNGRTLLRVSVQGYNSQEDIERLLDGLRRELSEVAGRRTPSG